MEALQHVLLFVGSYIASERSLSLTYHPFKVTVSNPAEVAKTRLQLQGELAKEGGKKVYKHALDVFSKTWKNEGIRGMQRGLYPAVRRITCLKLCLSSLIVCIPSKSRWSYHLLSTDI